MVTVRKAGVADGGTGVGSLVCVDSCIALESQILDRDF